MADAPNSYKDAYWSQLADSASAKAGIPVGLLNSIVNYGERSNNNQVSEAGARTPFQIIPKTRKAIIDKYGIDPYLSPENAAEGAALLLKESLDRNDGDVASAVGEYHGGTDRKNWGPKTNAYVNRVLNGHDIARVQAIGADFDKWLQENPAVLPESQKSSTNSSKPVDASKVPDTSQALAGFDQWVNEQKNKPAPPEDLGFFGGIAESITGNKRATETTNTLPDWAGMPELNQFSLASAKTGLGTMFAQPDEIAQIVKANYPKAQVRQDEKGNYVIRSSIDGKEYAIPPGLQWSDLPRLLGGLAAFTPAGRATSIAGSALAAGGTQAAIEASQAATGGSFSPTDVAVTGAVGGLVPAALTGIKAGSGAIADAVKSRVLNRGAQEAAGAPGAQMVDDVAQQAAPPVVPVSSPAPTAPVAPVEPLNLRQTADIAKKAANDGRGSANAMDELAAQIKPDEKITASAKRLGIEDELQPDQLTTNQIYRQLSQAVKSVPGSQAKARADEGLVKVAKRADDLITELGGSRDLSLLNQRVKRDLQNTHTQLDERAEKLFAQVEKAIPNQTQVVAENTLSLIKQNAKDLGGAENLSKLEQELLKKLQSKPIYFESQKGRLDEIGKVNPTYKLLDTLRKKVGDAIKNRGEFKEEEIGLKKNLYKSLIEDQQIVANDHGIGKLFGEAKLAVKLRKGIEDDLVSLFGERVEGSLVSDLGNAIRVLPKGDDSQLVKFIKSVPENLRQDVAASGLNFAFNRASKQGPINFSKYADWYAGLRQNKQAYTALMTNLPPKARRQLNDLYRISTGINKASKEFIGTGRLREGVKVFESANNLAGRLYEAAKHQSTSIAAGMAGSVVHPGIGVALASALSKGPKTPAIEAVDKLLASPQFLETVKQYASGAPRQQQQAAKKLANSKVFSNFVFKLQKPGELSNRERWILQSLEAQSANQNQPQTPVPMSQAR